MILRPAAPPEPVQHPVSSAGLELLRGCRFVEDYPTSRAQVYIVFGICQAIWARILTFAEIFMSDAMSYAQFSFVAGVGFTIAGAAALGGGIWYTRRRVRS